MLALTSIARRRPTAMSRPTIGGKSLESQYFALRDRLGPDPRPPTVLWTSADRRGRKCDQASAPLQLIQGSHKRATRTEVPAKLDHPPGPTTRSVQGCGVGMFCMACGQSALQTDQFCRHCGARLPGRQEARDLTTSGRSGHSAARGVPADAPLADWADGGEQPESQSQKYPSAQVSDDLHPDARKYQPGTAGESVLVVLDAGTLRIGKRDVPVRLLARLFCGLLLLVASFLDWFTYETPYSTVSENAWGTGFLAYTGVELGLIAVALAVFRFLAPDSLPDSWLPGERLIVVIAVLSPVCILLKLAVGMNVLGATVDFNPAPGLWLGLAAAVLITVLSGLALAPPATARPGPGDIERRQSPDRDSAESVVRGQESHEGATPAPPTPERSTKQR